MKIVPPICDARAKQLKSEADVIRAIADRYEAGDLTEVAIVMNDRKNNCFESFGVFLDRWRLLGAIEYAKQNAMKTD